MTTRHDILMKHAVDADVTALNDQATIRAAREECRPYPLPSVLESVEAKRITATLPKVAWVHLLSPRGEGFQGWWVMRNKQPLHDRPFEKREDAIEFLRTWNASN